MNEASRSFPTPDSPVIRTFALVELTRSARPTASRIREERANSSITILFSKSWGYHCQTPPATQLASTRARDVRGRKTSAPFAQIHGLQNRRNPEGSARPFYSLRLEPQHGLLS